MNQDTQGPTPEPRPPVPEPQPAAPPPPSAPAPDPYGLGPTSMGMAPHIAGALSYVPPLVTGLLFFLTEKQNTFVRFHGMQSILLGAVWLGLFILFNMLFIPIVFAGGLLILYIMWLLNVALLITAVVCVFQASTGKWFRLPIIGDIAAKQAGLGT